MSAGEAIIKFDDVSFEYGHNKPILDEVNFVVRQGSKLALMGQNGAGKRDRKSTRLNSSHIPLSRMPSSA